MSASPSLADSLLAIKTLAVAPKIKPKISSDFAAENSRKNSENRFRDEFKKADENVAKKRQDIKSDAEKSANIADKNSEKDSVDVSKKEASGSNECAKDGAEKCAKNVDHADKNALDSNDTAAKNAAHDDTAKVSATDEKNGTNTQDEESVTEPILTAIEPALAPIAAPPLSGEGGEVLPQGGQTISAENAEALPPLSFLDDGETVTAKTTTVGTTAVGITAAETTASSSIADDAIAPILTPATDGKAAIGQTPEAIIPSAATDDVKTPPLTAQQLAAEQLAANEQRVADQSAIATAEITDPALLGKSSAVSTEDAAKASAKSTTDSATLISEPSDPLPRTTENSARDGGEAGSESEEQLEQLFKPQITKAGTENNSQEGVKQTARTDIPLPAFQGHAPTAKVDAVANAAKAAAEQAETKPSANIESASTVRATPHDNKWAQTLSTLQQIRGNSSENTQFKLPMSLQNKEWGSAVADKVMWMASKNIQSAEVHLDPPELGPMQVRIAVNQEHVSVNFISHNATVRDMLDQNSFRLREMFDQGGMNLVDVDVSDRSAQQRQQDGGDGSSGAHSQGGAEGDVMPEQQNLATALALTNLVDYYV